jgi:hypothetical protein
VGRITDGTKADVVDAIKRTRAAVENRVMVVEYQ